MSQAVYANTTSDEYLCRPRDLRCVVCNGYRLEIVQVPGSFMIRDWDALEALGLRDALAMEAILKGLKPAQAKSVIIRNAKGSEREVGCFVSLDGAMAMALACEDVSAHGSASHAFLLWLAEHAAATRPAATSCSGMCEDRTSAGSLGAPVHHRLAQSS